MRLIFSGLLCLCVRAAAAQSGAVAELDTNVAETGNPFGLQLRVPGEAGKPDTVDFVVWSDVMPPENILEQSPWRQQGNYWVKDLTLIAFDSTALTLPPLPIYLRDGRVLHTDTATIAILPTPAPEDPADMLGIKDIRREPTLWTDYIPLGVAALVLVLVSLLALWLYRRRRKRNALRRTVTLPPMPPHELALRKLAALEQQRHWEHGRFNAFYTELSFLLREYLEGRFGVKALESTTFETMEGIRSLGFELEAQEALHGVLHWADLVKFAQAIPPAGFHTQSLDTVRRFVESTVPPPQPAGQATQTTAA